MFKTLNSEQILSLPLFTVYDDTLELPCGTRHFYRIEKRPVVIIIPLIDDKIAMIKQYRHSIKSMSIELPAGQVEENEEIVDCASRELQEETGYAAKNVELILSFNPTNECSNQVYHICVATDLSFTKQSLDEDEYITTVNLGEDDVMKKIFDGAIMDGRTITALLFYKYIGRC